MDTNQSDSSAEGSKQSSSQDFDKLVKGITRDSVRQRLRYTPDLPRDRAATVTLRLYLRADGT